IALINPHAPSAGAPDSVSGTRASGHSNAADTLKRGHQTAPVGVHALACSAPPFHQLCSAGLAFKLAHALIKRGRETNLPGAAEFDVRLLLDLAALGTIADIVPLTG